MYLLEIFTGAAHEQAMEALKVCAVLHLLFEDISNIAVTADMGDFEGAIDHPFLNRILFVFNLMVAFSGHDVAPLDASVIIIVKVSR
jgi:hypothetical protein